MLHILPSEELADDLNRLKHARDAFADLGPIASNHMLVERFTRAEPEPVSPGIHGGERRRSLRYRCWVHPPARAGDTRANVTLRLLCKKGHDIPDERRVPLFWHPWLEVIRSHHAAHPRAFSGNGVVHDLLRAELLEHCGVSNLC